MRNIFLNAKKKIRLFLLFLAFRASQNSIKGLNQLRNFVLLQNAKIDNAKKTIVLSEFHHLALSAKKTFRTNII